MRRRALARAGWASLLCAATSVAWPAPAAGQQGGAGMVVAVTDSATREPLALAQVRLDDGRGGLTDAQGVARLEGLRAGRASVRVHLLGYAARTVAVVLEEGRTALVAVALPAEAIPLPAVRATVPDVRSRELRDFYARSQTGTGQYFTRADIERRHLRSLGELFRSVPGLWMVSTPAGDRPMMEAKTSAAPDPGKRRGDCAIQYFLDGTPFQASHDGMITADVRLDEIEGIEIYRRGSTVPAKFNRTNNNCGVVLIWKKERV